MSQFFLAIGSILAGLSVAGGAFASHALKDSLSDRYLEIFETGTRYQMYHALALLLVALLLAQEKFSPRFLGASGYAFIIGILIFSGSLYALSLTGINWLGAITPIGGAAFLVGWFFLALSAFYFQ
jgi:uncharacterized membrane protein YgdD (TMEM256/DUF423 family)